MINFVAILALVTFRLVQPFPAVEECEFLDLTHPLNEQTINWPTANKFEHKLVFQGETEKGYYYSSYDISASEHVGTHLDAPIHFYSQRQSTADIPLQRLVGEACVVDLSSKIGDNATYQVTVEDLQQWEKKHGIISSSCILMIRTGWDRFYPNKTKYLGTAFKDVKYLRFPGIDPKTAKWLSETREIKAVGLDTASLDYGQSIDFKAHQFFARQNIPGIENLNNLDKLPPRKATVFILPAKIQDGSGGPVRAVAIGWNTVKDPCRRSKGARVAVNLLIVLLFFSYVQFMYVP